MSAKATHPVTSVRIEPLEPLLFGDNRPARPGLDPLQLDQDPVPLTVHGAIGRLLAGKPGSSWPDSLLGPWREDILAPVEKGAPIAELLGWCHEDKEERLLFPSPASLRCRLSWRGKVRALEPLTPVAVNEAITSADSPYLALAEPEENEYKGPVWLSEEALTETLMGRTPEYGLFPEEELFRREPRPGIAIDNDLGTVLEGYFFTRPYRRFPPGELDPSRRYKPGFRAWFQTLEPLVPPRNATTIGFLGGDRRRSRFSFPETFTGRTDVLAAMRTRIERAAPDSRGFCLYLLTPAIALGKESFEFPNLGRPLVSVVSKPRYSSGWDVEGCSPRSLMALIPEGSIFFFEWPRNEDRIELLRGRWLAPLQEVGAAAGFGRTLVGVW